MKRLAYALPSSVAAIWLLGASYVLAQDAHGDGSKSFAARCAGCHGSDGQGGEHAPGIIDFPRGNSRSQSPEKLREVIQQGLADSGMPAFHFPAPELNAVAEYVLELRAPAALHPPAGDIEKGKAYFAGQGKCLDCHMLSGHGGILGPDLSNLGKVRRLAQIVQALRQPQLLHTPGFRPVVARLKSGETLRGIAKNETLFDLQLQAVDGHLHLLSGEQIAQRTYEPATLMPVVRAGEGEMQNLIAYLASLTGKTDESVTAIPNRATADGMAFTEIVHPKPGNWPTYNGQLGGNRHSSLRQINRANVGQLAPKWMFPIFNRRLEGTPIVVDGIMYATTANEVYALDAARGRQIWHFQRSLTKGVIGDADGAINRGVALLGDKVFLVTDDARMIALNRWNGSLLWETVMANYQDHYGGTSAPLVVKNLVLAGTSGGDEGVRGFVDAFDTETGKRAWRFWAMPAPGEPLSETWKGRAIEHGCVTGWLTGTYDPTTDLIYWPTGNPCPDYNGDERQGDNLYSSSVVALEPKSGKVNWYFQFTPHDLHDWDATETPMLVDTTFRGENRKLLLHANRNGFFYVLDRTNGKFLLGKPFVHKITWASGIGANGRPELLPNAEPTMGGTRTCPSVAGATNWMSNSYSAATGLFYVMATESCAIYTKSSAWWKPGESFYGGGARGVPNEPNEKFLRAIDIQTGKVVWEVPQIGAGGPGGGWGGLLSTDGGLVFYCDNSGAFAAVDSTGGKPLWNFHTNEGWHASPMTYTVDGKQFVAVAAGSNLFAFALP